MRDFVGPFRMDGSSERLLRPCRFSCTVRDVSEWRWEVGGKRGGRWSEYVYITYKLLTCHQMTTVAFHDITTMI